MIQPSDPAGWSAASCQPLEEGLDTLDDVLHQVALDELIAASKTSERPQKGVVRLVVRVATRGIERATELGLLEVDGSADKTVASARLRESLARLLAEIIDAEDARLHAQCIDFVFGLGIQLGISQTQIAEQHRMSRANVSKICIGIRERYDVPPSRGMKNDDARESYRDRQIGKRAKPARQAWLFAASLKGVMHGL